jgi:tetratricopeptide (TPR) repeat protein
MLSNAFLLNLSGLDHERFQVNLSDTGGAISAQTEFIWRTETVAFEEDLRSLEALALFPNLDAQFHKEFGQRLYHALFGGDVGTEYARQLATVDSPLPIILRIDPQTAQPLTRLPWELLHNGREFLALNPRTTISRLPYEVPLRAVGAVPGTLRLLIIVANPDDLPDEYRLDVEAERETILAATEKLQREGRLGVDFLEDASLEAIEDALVDTRYHILHVTGHGDFDQQTKHGVLLLEDERGGTRRVTGPKLIQTLCGSGLRLIVLSACRTATAAHRAAYRDLGSQLAAGFPASLTMQYPVADVAATDFAEKLYRGICRGDDLHTSVARARKSLLSEKSGPAAFATPVAYVSDPLCLQVDHATEPDNRTPHGLLDFGLVPKMERGFVARGRELRLLRRKLTSNDWSTAIIHGIGGIGKSALASRLALRLVESGAVEGVKVINCSPTLTADGVLTELNAFLNLAGDNRLNAVLHQPMPLQAKTAVLAQALEAHSFLVIFDNIEDCLKKGRIVSRAVQAISLSGSASSLTLDTLSVTDWVDQGLGKQIAQLVGSVPSGTRFLFTSRVDFEPVEPGRIGDRIGHVGLGELSFVAAAQLMNRRDSLANLPVVSEAGVLTKRSLYKSLGGHPWALDQFARRVERLPIQDTLRVVEGLRDDLLTFTLIEKAVKEQSERARLLLRRAAVFEEAVPVEGLAYMMGDERDAMPDASDEIQSLLSWGLVERPPGSDEYVIHTVVRDWARAQWNADERLALLRRVAQYWQAVGRESSSLRAYLNARHYLFEAGDYEQAGEIVQVAGQYLIRWGQIELVLRLLSESVSTLQGRSLAMARGNLASVYKSLGDYNNARKEYEAVLAEFSAIGDERFVAGCLHNLGMLYQAQGAYEEARKNYKDALEIFRKLGDRASIGLCLHQLGMLHQHQGEFDLALEHCKQSLEIAEEVGDQASIAASLHQLGMLYQHQGDFDLALEHYQRALAIEKELGSREGVAGSLHNLGILHHKLGNYAQAREHYELALEIWLRLGDRASMAESLHQLGMLHQHQGEYVRARKRYEQALLIAQEVGDRASIALTQGQIGLILTQEGDFNAAVRALAQAYVIFQQLGMPDQQIAARSLAHLREKMGDETFTLAWQTGIGSSDEPNLLDNTDQSMTVEQVIQVVVAKTVAVLGKRQEQKQEWWQLLGEWQAEAYEKGLESLARFLGIVQQLVGGTDPEKLNVQVPAGLRVAWQSIMRGISTKGLSDGQAVDQTTRTNG